MVMVTGGHGQGQNDLAAELINKINTTGKVADCGSCGFDEPLSAAFIKDYHRLVKRLIEEGEDPADYTSKLIEANPQAVITVDEVGCGVVPIEASAREYRETVGRVSCLIAAASDEVYRMYCGIPTKIKG
ncbi:MAG: hypothetical protein E7241_03710 [Lachnospiraceae bacterium]|nr:hypothetical protein [Lachnospiraceae bacterium]